MTRIGWIYFLLLLAALAITGQVIYIQVVQGDALRREAEQISQRSMILPATRGDILADDGRALASSVPRFNLAIDPNSKGMKPDSLFWNNIEPLSAGLARLFGDHTAAYYSRIIRQARKAGKKYLILKRNISFEESEKVRQLPLFNLGKYKGGLILERVTSRERPYDLLASRTIGYLNKGSSGTVVGLEGAYDHELKGREGLRYEHRIGGGQWIPVSLDNAIEPVDGKDVVSTINIKFQDVAEQALYELLQSHQADHGCAVLMKVATGEVLAIANLGRTSDGNYHENFNYAIGERVEPGSTFKLPAIMAALEDEYVTLDDTVNTFHGAFKFYDRYVYDSHKGGFGVLTVRQVIEKSSNIGMARLIDRCYHNNPQHFIDRLYAMGIDKPLNLDILGDPPPRIKKPGDPDWWGTTLPWMAHGYELELTPMQILTFYNAIANNGKMVKPRFVKGLRDHSLMVRTMKTEVIKNSICSRSTLKLARELLEGVVERGTASNLRPKYYKIAGKTGTAVIARNDRGYVDEAGNKAYRASFVGYFPADHPMFSCIVVISRPNMREYYGNKVAGSVFQTIADKVYATELALHPQLTVPDVLPAGQRLPVVRPGVWNEVSLLLHDLNFKVSGNTTSAFSVAALPQGSGYRLEPVGTAPAQLPDLRGFGLKDALPVLENLGLKVKINGYGFITAQTPAAGTPVRGLHQIQLELSVNEEYKATVIPAAGS